MRKSSSVCFLVVLVTTLAAGCASRKYVRTEMVALEDRTLERIEGVEGQVEQNQTRLNEQEVRLDEQEVHLAEISKTAQEALDRAIAAGKLAEGRFLYETVLTEDSIRFEFDRAELSAQGRSSLDAFASVLGEQGEDVYIEIQGHTDAIGTAQYNLRLGAERAEAVRRYLNGDRNLPLHRMSVISYGESEPLAGNGSREERALNRRVALVVLK